MQRLQLKVLYRHEEKTMSVEESVGEGEDKQRGVRVELDGQNE